MRPLLNPKTTVAITAFWQRQWRSLSGAFEQGDDNFLLLRLIAASMVIYAHSYPLSGMHKADIFVRNGWGTNAGAIAVNLFFCVSGFLVTGSLVRWNNTVAFIKARALRLFPAYAVCLLVCAYMLGPAVTSLPLDAYLHNASTHSYVTGNLGLRHMQHTLPGVFESLPYTGAVNGSIWTLPAEATMYLWLAALGTFGFFRRTWLATCAVLALALVASRYWLDMPVLSVNPRYLPFATMFAIGVLAYLHRSRIPLGHLGMLASVTVAWATHRSIFGNATLLLAQAYFCFWFAYCVPWRGFNRLGDYSYGVYLWGFPCQQFVVLWLGHPRPAQICLLALPMALALALVSWHVVEQPALRLKKWSLLRTFFENRQAYERAVPSTPE